MNFLRFNLQMFLRLGNRFAGIGFLAIMAFELGLPVVLAHIKAAGYRLAVAGAVGVGAAKHFADGVGQRKAQFLHHLVIVNMVHNGFGSEQGKAVGIGFAKYYIFDFDDVFAALWVAGQVEAHGYCAAVVQHFELAQDGERQPCGDMVDNSAVFYGFYT